MLNLQNILNQDIWLQYSSTDGQIYKLRLGSTGAISNIINSESTELLCPSYQDEKTDRIIQWTLWSETLQNPITTLPKFEYRYNVTQSGDFKGNFNPTLSITVDKDTINVYSAPILNWKSEQQTYFTGGFKALTQYKINPNNTSIIHISRYIFVDKIFYSNQLTKLGSVYLEAWTPLHKSIYNSIAMSFNSNYKPEWWYDDKNLPQYPNFKLDNTNGYMIAFDSTNFDNESFAIIYGKENLSKDQGEVLINMTSWNTGIGLLPALSINNLEQYNLIELNYAIMFNKGLNEKFITIVESTVHTIPKPKIYNTITIQSNKKLYDIYNTLYRLNSINGIQTDQIGTLLFKKN